MGVALMDGVTITGEIAFSIMPLGMPWIGLPGTSGHYISTPDTAALDLTGDIEIVMRLSMDDWTPAAIQTILGKGNTAYRVYINTNGTITLGVYVSGVERTPTSSAAPSINNGVDMWLKVTRASGSGNTNFYTAPAQSLHEEPTSWTQLGTANIASTAGAVGTNSTNLYLGTYDGTNERLAGRVYEAIVRSAIGGAKAAHFRGADVYGTATLNSPTGEVWTVAGASFTSPWVDVSPYIRSAEVSRGRTDEYDSYKAGTCTLELSNGDRRFDSTYTLSPYYPNVKVNRQVRLWATYGGTTYPLFHGYVNEWPQEYVIHDNDATCTVPCTDGFKILGRAICPESVWAYEIAKLAPWSWHRLDEELGDVAWDQSGNNRNGVYWPSRDLTPITDSLTPYSTDGAIDVWDTRRSDPASDPNNSEAGIIVPGYNGSVPFTLILWEWVDLVAINTIGNPPAILWMMRDSFNDRIATLMFLPLTSTPGDLGADVYAYFGDQASSTYRQTAITDYFGGPGLGPNTVAGNVARMWLVVFQAGAAPKLYLNGASTGSGGGAGTGLSLGSTTEGRIGLDIGPMTMFSSGVQSQGFKGVLDECVVLQGDYSAYALPLYQAATTPWVSDYTGQRIGRLLDMAAWPSWLRNLATGITVLGPAMWGDREAALGRMVEVEHTEYGHLYMGTDGRVVFRDRYWRLSNSKAITPQWTLTDGSTLTYVDLPGTSGNHVSTPDTATIDLTGDLDIAVRVAMDDWTPSVIQTLIGKGNTAYRVYVNTDGTITLGVYVSAVERTPTSSVAPTVSNGQALWLRVTRNATTGATNFYTAADRPSLPTQWTQLGSADVASTTGAVGTNATALYLGTYNGTSELLAGNVYEAVVLSGISGIEAAHFRAWEIDKTTLTGVAAGTGETWTLNGTAALVCPAGQYQEIEPDGGSDAWVRTRVTGRRKGGAYELAAKDSTSQGTYTDFAEDYGETINQYDSEVVDLVSYRLAERKTQRPRILSLVVNPRLDPTTMFAQVLGRDIGERVRVVRTPLRLGNPNVIDSHVEGITHSITPKTWSTQYYLTPADAAPVLILDDPVYGVLDANVLAP